MSSQLTFFKEVEKRRQEKFDQLLNFNAGGLDTLKSRVSAVETTSNTNTTTNNAQDTSIATLDSTLTNTTVLAHTNATDISAIQVVNNNYDTRFSTVESNVTTNANDITTTQTNLASLDTRVGNNETAITNNNTASSTNTTDITNIDTRLGHIENTIVDSNYFITTGFRISRTASTVSGDSFIVDTFNLSSSNSRIHCTGTISSFGIADNATSGTSQYNFSFTLVRNSVDGVYLVQNVDPKIVTSNSVQNVSFSTSGNLLQMTISPQVALTYEAVFYVRYSGSFTANFASSDTLATVLAVY